MKILTAVYRPAKTLNMRSVFRLFVIITLFFNSHSGSAQSGETLNFDGANDYVSTPSVSLGSNWTIEAWFNCGNVSNGVWESIVTESYWGNTQGLAIVVYNGTLICTAPTGVVLQASVTSNMWYHVAVSFDNGTWIMYRNGLIVDVAQGSYAQSSNPLYIGCRDNNTNSGIQDYFNGDIDEVRVWTVTRTGCDIQSYMSCEIPSTSAGLVRNYHFNQGSANGLNTFVTSLTDAASGANGTLNNFGLLLLFSSSNWTSPGAISPSGYTVATVPAPEVNVTGNGNNIADGTTVTQLNDYTDFGTSYTRTFVVQNTGTTALSISKPWFTGGNPSMYTITIPPSSVVAASGSTSFEVTFVPSATGNRSVTLNFATTDCDEGIYSFNLTANGTGNALNFDGANDYIYLSNASQWALNNEWTVEMWARPTSSNSPQILLYAGYGCITCPEYALSIGPESTCSGAGTTGHFVFMIQGQYVQSANTVTPGVWTHLAVTYDGNTLKMYVNGVLQTVTPSFTLGIQNVSYMNIGADPGCGLRYPFGGGMDELRVWNRALCQTEVQTYMNCEITTSLPNLVNNLHFDQGLGSVSNSTITLATNNGTNAAGGTLTNFQLTGTTSNWINSGTVSVSSICTPSALPDIKITGTGTLIPSGTNTTTTLNGTSMGSVVANGVATTTFNIFNTGTGTLNISSYSFSGPNASNFSITNGPAGVIAPLSGSTSLVIAFSSTIAGANSATLNIASDDCDESPYTFVLTSTVVPIAEALNFDGVNDKVSIPNTTALDNLMTGPFTFEAWIKTNGTTYRTILSKGDGSGVLGTGEYIFQIDNSGRPSLFHTASNGWLYNNIPINTNVWTHVAVTFDGSYVKFYIDGQPYAVRNSTVSTYTTGATAPLLLGVQGSTCNCNFFSGDMDEVRVWNVCRTPCEIVSSYSINIPATSTGLLAYYKFNQGGFGIANPTETVAIDQTGANNGALANFSLTGTASNWDYPGSGVTGTTAVSPTGSLVILGNSVVIAQGDMTPNSSDFTDFGTLTTRTFVLQNPGTSALTIAYGSFSGANASNFAVTALPSTLIPAGGSTSVTITFSGTALGTQSAVLTIFSTDCTTPNYSFAISASVSPASCMIFDGVDDRLSHAVLTTQNNDITLQGKVMVTGLTGTAQVLFYNGSTSTSGYGFYLASGSTEVKILYGGVVFTSTGYSITLNQWESLTLVIQPSGLLQFYANGNFIGQYLSGSPNTPGTGFFIGGNDLGYENLKGKVDEVRLWNRALTYCEIMTYEQCEIPGAMTNLVGNYHFNQGVPSGSNTSITTVLDDSGNNNHLTIGNMVMTGTVSNFVTPGAIVNGYTTVTVPTGTMGVTGNGTGISNGSTGTSTLNFTDFGTSGTRTYSAVLSAGTGSIFLSSYSLGGANANQFSITSVSGGSVITSTNTLGINVTFTPTSLGTKTAIVNLFTSDCLNPTYSFVIAGTSPTASALNFDGNDDYIETNAQITDLNQSDFTIEAWVKTTYTAMGVVTCADNNTNWDSGEKCFYIDAAGRPGFVGYACNYINGGIAVNDGNWHHIAVTWDEVSGSTGFGTMYVDGVATTATLNFTPVVPTYGTYKIGRANFYPFEGPNYFKGSLDEVRIWNTARTACEIQTYMNCEITGSVTGLMANYHFNEGVPQGSNTAVNTLTDNASSFTGTLTNVSLTGGTISNWVSGGSVANNFTVASPPSVTLTVTGNGNNVANGSTSSSVSNNTDFNNTTSRTFVASNSGTNTLWVNNLTITGSGASNFSLMTTVPFSVAPSGSTNFSVNFIPLTVGAKAATVQLTTNDCAATNYSFVITATAIPADALSFNGSGYVQTPVDADVDVMPNTTWEAWVMPTTTLATVQTIMGIGDGGFDRGVFIQNNNLYVNNGSTSSVAATFTQNQWQHVAAVYNTSASWVKLYVNGVLQFTSTTNYSTSVGTTTNNFMLGANQLPPSLFFNGKLDEVRVWNIERSQCDIQTYMNCEITGSLTGLVANYHFHQGVPSGTNTSVTTATDDAGTNTATLTTFALVGATGNWVSPGSAASNVTTATIPNVSLTITGNGNPISFGSSAPSLTNFTDFGSTVTRTFVVSNTGTGTLYLNSVKFTGAAASEFSFVPLGTSTLTGASSSSFAVISTPTSIGTKTAYVLLESGDCAHPTYSFEISIIVNPANALDFDGVDDHVRMLHTAALMPTVALSMECWVKPKSLAGTQYLISKGKDDLVDGQYGLLLISGVPYFNLYQSGFHTVNAGASLTSNTWNHLAATWDGKLMKIYVNGALKGAATYTTPLTFNTDSLQIGRLGKPASLYYANVVLDEIRIWNVARSQCDIQSYMSCEIPTTATGLVANYHFNQAVPAAPNGTATTLISSTGSNNGTLYNFALTGGTSNWVDPGSVTAGYTTTAVPAATALVTGNSSNIAPGTTTVSTTNFTDFQYNTSRTFVLNNTGTSSMDAWVYLSPGTTDFSLQTPVNGAQIAAGSNTNITILFTPTVAGTKTTVVYVSTNDCATPLYSFVISATTPPAAALSFDGVNDYISGPLPTASTNSVTIQAHVNYAGPAAAHQWILQNGTTGGYGMYLEATTGQLVVQIAGVSSFSTGYVIPNNTWKQLTAIFINNSCRVFADGIPVGTYTYASISAPTGSLFIGGFGSSYLNGSMDEVRIWSRALSECEVQTYTASEVATPTTGLRAYYQFNEGSPIVANPTSSTLIDASGNGFTQTLTNFTLTGSTSNWVATGAVVSGTIIPTPPASEINMVGNGNNIANGSTSTSTTNATDFGTGIFNVYTIQNTGSSALYITNPITLTGGSASEFSLTAMPPGTIAASSSATFGVYFIPASVGTKTALITIINSDCDEDITTFVISASTTTGTALNFRASSSDQVTIPSFTTNPFTCEFWFRTPLTNATVGLVQNVGNTTGGLMLGVYNGSLIAGNPSSPTIIDPSGLIQPNVWYHVALTYDQFSNTMTLYKNGVGVNSSVGTTQLSGTLVIGMQNGTYFTGDMDEFRLWNYARSACQVFNYINAEVVPPVSGLYSNYKFDQGIAAGPNTTITTLTDFSGNNNNGSLSAGFSRTGLYSNFITGTIVPGYTTVTVPQQEINVTGLGNNILTGDVFPTYLDNTDFSNTVTTGTYVVQNLGTAALGISSYSIIGPHASEFSFNVAPPNSLAPGASATFQVTFANTVPGIRSATVVLVNNDCDEGLYKFGIRAGLHQLYTGRYNNSKIAKARVDMVNACPGWANVSGSSIGVAADNINKRIYFTDNGSGNIGVINMDGTGLNNSLITGQTGVIGIAVDEYNQKIVYAMDTGNEIRMADLNGSNVVTIATVSACYDVAVDPYSRKIYFVAYGSNNIGVVNYDGSAKNPALITGGNSPYGLCVDLNARKVYWSNYSGSSLGSANMDGTGVNQNFITGLTGITDVVVDNSVGKIFFTTQSAIGSADISGSNVQTAYQPGLSGAWGLAIGGYLSPTLTIAASQNTSCAGSSVVLTSTTNATTYTWSSGANTATSAVNPTTTTIYTLVVTDAQSCTISATKQVTVYPIPTLGIVSSGPNICLNSSTTFTANGADTYTWTGGASAITGSLATVSPTSNTVYTLTGTYTLTGCPSTLTQSLFVLPLPTVNIVGTNTVCAASAVVFTANGAVTYSWNTGPTTQTISLAPPATTNYTVTGYDVNNCSSTASVQLQVFTNPTIVASSNSICSGQSYSIQLSGANTYTISGGATLVTPSITTTYSVDGTSTAGCNNTLQTVVTVTVYQTPSITVSNGTLCQGLPFVITPTGASTYTYSGGSATVSPLTNTFYTINGTSTAGCISTVAAVCNLTVYNSPTITANSGTICNGDAFTITPSGAASYTITGNTFTVTPSLTTSYSVVGTSSNGCLSPSAAVVQVTVFAIPAVTVNAGPICQGTSFTLVPTGAASYSFFNGGPVVTPNVSTSYSITGTSTAGCTSTLIAVADITVEPYPVVTVNSGTICVGQTFTINPSGASNYTIQGGSSVVQPNITSTYSVTASTPLAGCINTVPATSTVVVNALPNVTASVSQPTVCSGQTLTLNGGGAVTYTWSNGQTNATAFTPTASETATVTGTDVNNCVNTATISYVVNSLPVVSIAGTDSSICAGMNVTLTASGAPSYTWNTASSNTAVVVNPTVTTIYTVTGTAANGCTANVVYLLNVSPCTTSFSAIPLVYDVSCLNRNDGRIVIDTAIHLPKARTWFVWQPSSLCPDSTCATVDSIKGGVYAVKVLVLHEVRTGFSKYDSLIWTNLQVRDEHGPCGVTIYKGITPNNDGLNDVLDIANIDMFPRNKVSVFNRWGNEIYHIEGYNNHSKSWPDKGASSIEAGTYFYIVDLGNGDPPMKGWIEVVSD